MVKYRGGGYCLRGVGLASACSMGGGSIYMYIYICIYIYICGRNLYV